MVDLWCGSGENGNGGEGKTIEIRGSKKGGKKELLSRFVCLSSWK